MNRGYQQTWDFFLFHLPRSFLPPHLLQRQMAKLTETKKTSLALAAQMHSAFLFFSFLRGSASPRNLPPREPLLPPRVLSAYVSAALFLQSVKASSGNRIAWVDLLGQRATNSIASTAAYRQ